MHFTDIFIQRPVLATVISLFILVLGIRSLTLLQIRQYPYTENAVITVSTVYTGADPALIAGFITTPLENSIAQAQGIDYLTSSSTQGSSEISAHLLLNYDPNKALTEINTKVNAVINQLPQQAQQPTLSIAIGETINSMYIGFYSPKLASNQITDYLTRVVQSQLQAIHGVQQAEIVGQHLFSLRAWLDPAKLASYGLGADEVAHALSDNNFIAAVGRTKGGMVTVDLTISTGLTHLEQFQNLIIKAHNGAIIRLKDVGKVTLGSQSYDTAVKFDNKPAVYIGIKIAPTANVLSVIKNIRKAIPDIFAQLPQGLNGKIVYDESRYINSAIREVMTSLVEALVIVTLVIFLFLGSVRSVIIPVIAMPLSLIGAFFIMLLLGYTINLLTLLALVLAIGLVVDDAIIIVENIYRHIEQGQSVFESAIQGARELAIPIISISVVLIAVYVPIGFMGGLTGALFTEFAFTLAGAVAISAIIALTLSPMMCSLSLKPPIKGSSRGFVGFIDDKFEQLRDYYEKILERSLNNVSVTLVFALIILSSIYFLYATSKRELAPQEDQGIIISVLTAAPNATLQQTQLYSNQMFQIFKSYSETDHIFQLDGVNGLNTSIGGMVFKPWNERKRTTNELQPQIQQSLDGIAGARVAAFQKPSLPGGGSGLPVQFVITTTDDYVKLNDVSQRLLDEARQSGLFVYLDSDLKLDKPQTSIQLDRNKASLLGLTMADVGNLLASAMSENYINYFNFDGRSYQVIPQVMQGYRLNADQLLNYYLKLPNGTTISLSTIARLKTLVVPESINHFQQLNSATISAIPFPGVAMGEALQGLKTMTKKIFPENYNMDYAAQSRQYQQESSALMLTFFLALIIIFLCLAAQFESFRDPFIILVSVPMSMCGALIFISLGIGGASLNIYTEVGLVTLIGLISKHGILIVQFANDRQQEGHEKRDAIQMAAGIRLRPILMTTASMVLGVIPLILATGAGAMSRFNIGLVIASGISIGTLFTLFVLPAMYLVFAEEHHSKRRANDIESDQRLTTP
ncbi:efflux RND transporter permease subunit [Rickettsiella grylli]|uniref:Transporter, AcrB/AcrD/AcrF family n=1 Tax=Rickettsiella grylli TaxID=59196 RepID=A8PKQ0_9COXI|nr:efflux RND transporter permease subunit [Rickettsiella grylli]EDP46696.1 transporter, AcrB/AcrD/AcrF family [Rickettsiella grylli]